MEITSLIILASILINKIFLKIYKFVVTVKHKKNRQLLHHQSVRHFSQQMERKKISFAGI